MTNDPAKDLRSLGARLFDRRDVPIATGTEALRPAANMIRANSFYFSTDTGVLWYSTGSVWTAASNAFGPKVSVAKVETEQNETSATFSTLSGPTISGLDDGIYAVVWGSSANGDAAASGSAAFMAVRYNGSTETAAAETQTQAIHVSIARADLITLTQGAGANSLQCVYRTQIAGHTSVFRARWLLSMKLS